MNWITTHHELCDGTECATWDCASLPENVGQWRQGSVTTVNDDGSVLIEWADGTTSTLPPRRPVNPLAPWLEAVRQNGKCGSSMCACQTLNLEESQNDD